MICAKRVLEKFSESTQDVLGDLKVLQCVGKVSDPSIPYLCNGSEECRTKAVGNPFSLIVPFNGIAQKRPF